MKYLITDIESVGNLSVPDGALFMAVDSDHAEEQMENEKSSANITWIVQTDDMEHAFNVYHKESSSEEATVFFLHSPIIMINI